VLDKKGRYAIADALAGDVPFRPSSFEGLEIPLAKLPERRAIQPEGGAWQPRTRGSRVAHIGTLARHRRPRKT
jgi:hypothetical protein